jgi:hypothetical protein
MASSAFHDTSTNDAKYGKSHALDAEGFAQQFRKRHLQKCHWSLPG